MRRRSALISGIAALASGTAALIYAFWWRKHPSACPYGLHVLIELPRPFLTRARLRGILTPQPGERVLEVGPGTGYYSLRVAEWLRPGGTLYVLDVQEQMLDHLMRRAKERGVENIVPTMADARDLPYSDDNFDAAFLTLVLGEIPDQDGALSELRRVLKPGGHLVVGELFPDFHMVPFRTLQKRAEAVGFRFERRLGSALGYFARFRAP
jgi:ubiquinone/menaquinone biosynthesis C-methylase UbiE